MQLNMLKWVTSQVGKLRGVGLVARRYDAWLSITLAIVAGVWFGMAPDVALAASCPHAWGGHCPNGCTYYFTIDCDIHGCSEPGCVPGPPQTVCQTRHCTRESYTCSGIGPSFIVRSCEDIRYICEPGTGIGCPCFGAC